MKYLHVLNYVRSAIWAIDRDKMDEILSILAFRVSGGLFTDDEIKARIGDGQNGSTSSQAGATAVIPLRGVIAHRMGGMNESSGGMSAERFTRMVQAATADPNITAILLDVDSPGGTVNGVTEAAQAVYDARQVKPVIALANGFMASAAYWASSQAHEIVAVPSLLDSSIGSIGVYTVHADMSGALEKEGIKPTMISAGKYKLAANPFEPLSDAERAVIQSKVDATYERFLADVARGRGVDVSAVRDGYGEGRALSAKAAKAAGMVDRIATMDATLARLSSPQIRGKIMSGQRAELADGEMFSSDELTILDGHQVRIYASSSGIIRTRISSDGTVLGMDKADGESQTVLVTHAEDDRLRRFRLL